MHKFISTGFSLIELMIVIAIMAIIATLAIPPYYHYVNRTHVVTAINIFTPIQRQITERYLIQSDNGFDNIDMSAMDGVSNIDRAEINHTSGLVSLYLNKPQAVIYFEPQASNRGLVWNCYSQLPQSSLPNTCEHIEQSMSS